MLDVVQLIDCNDAMVHDAEMTMVGHTDQRPNILLFICCWESKKNKNIAFRQLNEIEIQKQLVWGNLPIPWFCCCGGLCVE